MANTRMGPAAAIATHFSADVNDIREARYHYGHTGRLQIFTLGDDYYTATKLGTTPPKVKGYTFDWQDCQSWATESYGWVIWKYTPSE